MADVHPIPGAPPLRAGGPLGESLRRLRRLVLGGQSGRRELAEALAEVEALADEVWARDAESLAFAERMEGACEQAQAQLLRYRELFEFAPDAYLVTDLQGIVREANRAAADLLGSPWELLRDKPMAFFVAGEQRRPFYLQLVYLRRLEAGLVRSWEMRLKRRKGPPVEAAVTVTVDADASGRAVGLRWLLRDVSARAHAEEALRAETAFADSLVDAAQVAVLVLGAAGGVLRANAYAEALAGCAPGDLLGRDWAEALLDGPDREAARQAVRQAADTYQDRRAVHAVRAGGGRRRSLLWSYRRLAGPPGRPPLVLAVGQDITELQEAQEQALRWERLAAIGQMVTGLAHESRNALQRSQACLEMLRWRLQGQPEALDLVARTLQAQRDLLRLYEDVRNYAAPIQLDCKPCDLGRLWREVWDELAPAYSGRDVRLAEEAGGVDLVVPADRFRLAQVFRNLLENALAASPDPVRVTVACAAADLDGRPALRLAVRDNGPGLTAEGRRRLFEPFYTTKVKGTGLGLAIAKRIVEAHGGQIAAGDPPGGGAEILIVLPRGEP